MCLFYRDKELNFSLTGANLQQPNRHKWHCSEQTRYPDRFAQSPERDWCVSSVYKQQKEPHMPCPKLIITISDSSDFFPAADYAVIVLTAASIERIKKLSIVVRQMKAYRISE